VRCLIGLLALLWLTPALAYQGNDHQFLTFLAAKHFNRCAEGTDIPPLTPLQVRYIARANSGLVERSVLARMFNWRYYDRADQSEQSMMWLVDTRFHDHFNDLSGRLTVMDDPVAAYQDLGRILSYVQLVTSPAHVVPVYTARFWRFSFNDRFDGYPLDEDAIEAAIGKDCGFLDEIPGSFEEILTGTADRTMQAVMSPIEGMPASWSDFWKPDRNPGNFGDYGPAGNSFGRRTEFRCGDRQRCVLLNDDPLYVEFAMARHLDAVQGTLKAMLLMQIGMRDTIASAQ
jgi:hypothetical protein